MSNSFERFAETQMVRATKAKHKAAETRARNKVVQSEKDAPMKLGPLEQKMEDSSRQMRLYRRYKRAELRALLEGSMAEQWRALLQYLKALTIEHGDALVDYVRHQHWLHDSDMDTRHTALSLIADAIIRLRVRNGYSPMDDSLPGESPTVFEIIRADLRVMT